MFDVQELKSREKCILPTNQIHTIERWDIIGTFDLLEDAKAFKADCEDARHGKFRIHTEVVPN